jgi:hypothetical protein
MEPESYREPLATLLRTRFGMSPEEIEDHLPHPLESRHVREYLPFLKFLGEGGESDDCSEYD